MEANLKLGKIWGIPIGLHISWFLIFGLLTWSLSTGYLPGEYPNLGVAAYVSLGVFTSLLFFGSVLAHELGHAFLALRNSIPVRGITLFIFGGVAQIEKEPTTPGAEFRIAIAGPLVSLALAVFFFLLWLLDQAIPYLAAPSIWLARINLILATFNMIPGFPLDGGRVLRAIIWKVTGDVHRATRVASFTGQFVAFGFIGLGLLTIFQGNFLNGLWLAFIGWFLQNAAATSYAQSSLQRSIRGVRVEQVMQREFPRIPSLVSLQQLVNESILTGGQRAFFVTDNGHPLGVITLKDITQVPQRQWPFITTGQAMVPLARLVNVSPGTELLAALQSMDNAQIAQVPVVHQDELVGMLSREDILHYLRTRAELGF
jgi:Zn-dependent protease